jgi:beta-lactamase superfamily II metal-dependent hydrolase
MSNRKPGPFRSIAQLTVFLALLAVLAVVMLLRPHSTPAATPANAVLGITVLDVGQGDAIVLSSGGKTVLVDAGENGCGDDVVKYLKSRGVERLAAVVGTHPHSDHIGGLDEVLDAIPADMLYLSPRTADTETYEDVLDAAAGRGLTAIAPAPGDKFTLGGAEVTFLWPPKEYDGKEVNDWSLVLKVTAAGHGALLCGDIGEDAERALLDSGAVLGCDVLKVAHHGSGSSSNKDFLKAVSPAIVLISVGAGNDYGHPDKRTLSRLADVGAACYRTDKDGNITVYFGQYGITVDK